VSAVTCREGKASHRYGSSNIQLRSDFLWFIVLLSVGAVASAVLLIGRRRNAGSADA
jgi:hypothetical protein